MSDDAASSESETRARAFLAAMTRDLELAPQVLAQVRFDGAGDLASIFAVTDFAAAAVASASAAVAHFIATRFGTAPRVAVSRRLASLWFGFSIAPVGWTAGRFLHRGIRLPGTIRHPMVGSACTPMHPTIAPRRSKCWVCPPTRPQSPGR
jgi:hypothetical protein